MLAPMLKRPRFYAADILALPTVDQRRAALDLVPEPLRDWVAFYVRDHFEKQRCLRGLLGGVTVIHINRKR